MQAPRQLISFLKPYRHWAVLAPLMMALEVVMDLMQPRLLQQIIDKGVVRHDLPLVLRTGAWMATLAARGMASVGAIVSFHNYTRQFGRPLNDIANIYNTLQSALARAERVFEIIDETPETDAFIRRPPHGYDTVLSERGGNLSQGQCQMLAIASAVLTAPHILILDEATSSVDTRTEKHIQKAMRRFMAGRTSFVIAHRLSTVRDADQILVLNHGEIIERGAHPQLLAQQGFYYRLSNAVPSSNPPLKPSY